ncbi:MAG: tRNA (adenosine(37)-N6)-threonylcarbamoyltransferase complex dimerization subunit type 1 TsaB, partial [Rhizomicrobium sp.]
MKILAVDTALGACSAAILDGDAVRSHRFEQMDRGHAERLAPMVREAIEESGIPFAALDRLAVTVGPGTFTGQRIGYAFMRGMRLALDRPLIGVTTLAAMAKAAIARTGASGAAVLHDAKRGEVYVTAVVNGSTALPVQIATFDEAVRTILGATSSCREQLAFAGTAGQRAAERCREEGRSVLITDILTPDALWVARLALTESVPETVPPPLYLRAPDARLPLPQISAIAI